MTAEGTRNADRLDAVGRSLIESIAASADGTLGAAIFFGSRRTGLETTGFSAYDFVLSVAEARLFFEKMRGAGFLRRSPRLLSILDRALPPTQIRLAASDGVAVAKAAVVTVAELARATSPRRRDQFLAGRLFQDVGVVWARDAGARREAEAAIRAARAITLDWVAPDLPESFDASGYARQLLRTSFRFEVRPESRGRADAVFQTQRDALAEAFRDVLGAYEREGRLVARGEGLWSLAARPSGVARARRRAFLEWSRARATLRWPKHALTFDGWLEYIVRKAERHSGRPIRLTALERRAPFVFLWPRVLRFLLTQRRAK